MEPFDGELSRRLLGVVSDEFLHDLLERATASYRLTDTDEQRVLRYAQVKVEGIQSLARALNSDEDVEELHESLVTIWIELRSEWSRYNKTVNYRRLIHDEDDHVSAILGAICSGILSSIEPLIASHLYRLQNFAQSPLLAIARSGRFADRNVADRYITVGTLQPVVEAMAKLRHSFPFRPDDSEACTQWCMSFEVCRRTLEELIEEPVISTEVAKVALEERLLKLGDRRDLPFAPSVTIAGADRLPPHTVTTVIDSVERVFDSLYGALTPFEGPIQSRTDLRIDNHEIWARISILPSFFAAPVDRETVIRKLEAEGLHASFDQEHGLSLNYEVQAIK